MGNYQLLIDLFASSSQFETKENLTSFSLVARTISISIPELKEFYSALNTIPQRDFAVLNILMDKCDPITISTKSPMEDYCIFLGDLKEMIDGKDDDSIFSIKFEITKTIQHNILSIYSLASLVKFLGDNTSFYILSCFNNIINSNTHLVFQLLNDEDNFHTSTMFFCSNNNFNCSDTIDRISLISKRDTVCHFSNAAQIKLLPNDFYLQRVSQNEVLNNIFSELAFILSLIFISNSTSIEADRLTYRIDGYKIYTGNLNFLKEKSSTELFHIFEWTYQGGNLSDKIGLARNIISLHIRNNDIRDLEERTFASIKSNHEIYLKQNIQHYIEVKNKIAEFLNDMVLASSRIVESLTSSFKNSFLAIITFFISVVILNAVKGGKFNNIFTKDLTYISLVLLYLSLILLWGALCEVLIESKRFEDNYNNIKNRYTDLLDESDIANIFHNDSEHLSNKKYINNKVLIVTILWILSVAILGGFVLKFGRY